MAAIYKRGNVYWARAQRQGRENRVSLKTENRALAEKRLREWLGELESRAWGDKPRRTFEEATERFIREHYPTLKASTAKRYGVSLKNLAELFDGKMLDQISSATLSEFETERRKSGVTGATIRRDLTCLSSIIRSAIDWEWLEANPVLAFVQRRAKRGLREAPARTRYLSPVEEAKLFGAASKAQRAAMTLAVDTGLRREELFSLKWNQVDMVRGLISTTVNTKNGRIRKVPVSVRCRSILGTVTRHIDCPYVFVNPDTLDRYTQMNKGLKAAIRRAEIDDLCWHDLRRTAGCRWLQRDGVSMEKVSVLLGHSSSKVTSERYAFLNQEAVAVELASTQKPAHGTAVSTRKIKQQKAIAS